MLTSTLGFGHVKAAEAIDEGLRDRGIGIKVDHIDFWSLMDDTVASAIKEGYLSLVTGDPELWDRLHSLDRTQWKAFLRKPVSPGSLSTVCAEVLEKWFPDYSGFPATGRNLDQTLALNLLATYGAPSAAPRNLVRRGLILWMHRLLVSRLKSKLQRDKADLIVATQVMPASLLALLKRRGDLRDLPAVAVLTDYGIHPFWLKSRIEHYCVATRALAEELRRKGEGLSTTITGIPLKKGFEQPIAQAVARNQLDIGGSSPVVLITGGGYGIGAAESLRVMLEAGLDCQILVAAAIAPEKELRKLREICGDRPRQVRIFRHRSMSTLVRAADIVVGKPGGLSVAEALACGRPFFAVRCLGGQESYNVSFLRQNGVGGLCAHTALLGQLRSWIRDPQALMHVKARAWHLGNRKSTQRVVDVISTELRRRQQIRRQS
ncbi:MAG: MGDG synthase family glycosyltransferase [Wenzhouxiangella sp.]